MQLHPEKIFKCLSDGTRLKILFLLSSRKSLCVCDIHEALHEPQSKVSRHLSELRQCGLVQTEKKEKWVYYQLHTELPHWVINVLSEVNAVYQNEFSLLIESLNNKEDKRC